jgi:hypothetical protein
MIARLRIRQEVLFDPLQDMREELLFRADPLQEFHGDPEVVGWIGESVGDGAAGWISITGLHTKEQSLQLLPQIFSAPYR